MINERDEQIINAMRLSPTFTKGGGEKRKVPHYYIHIINAVKVTGLWLDFCIGRVSATTQHILRHSPDNVIIYGFDWFQGLPEDWIVSEKEVHTRGAFSISTDSKRIQDHIDRLHKTNKNLRVVQGLIQDTLPGFLREHREPCAFIHIDCDLYSSASCALRELHDNRRLVPGTVISFDEFYGFDNYREHEYRAFLEYIHNNYSYDFIAHVENKRQATIRISGILNDE